jgi:hypothetical protein
MDRPARRPPLIGGGRVGPWSGDPADLPSGYDDALIRAVQAREAAVAPTTLSFMAVAVSPAHDRRGLATTVLIEGTVTQWEIWTGMVFPVTRDYVVPEALNLVSTSTANVTAASMSRRTSGCSTTDPALVSR